MYFTRQQMASFAENKPAMAKSTYPKDLQLESNRVPSGQANSRRALGDIGNLVEVLSTRRNVIKDGLQDNPHGAAKNFPVVNRPVTRKSAEALASNQQLKKDTQVIDEPNENVPWGAKQQRTQSFSRNNHHQKHEIEGSVVDYMEDQITADLNETRTEDNEAVMNSFTAPNEGMHECCEVEMEDQDDPMPDIDEADAGNPMAVAEYVQDIYGFYKQSENLSCVPPDYMSHQTDINEKMRAILIDWLIEVHLKFELMDETLFLTVNLIDRYLSRQRVMRKHLQLVGVTAMLLACKYEEVCVPVVEDFVLISDRAYTREEVLQMEKLMLNTLQFNITVPTPYVFIKRFLKAAQADKELEALSFFLVELCLVESVMLRYQPSILAAAAVYTAQCTLGKVQSWDRTMEWHSSYSEDQLLECANLMVDFHQKAGEGKLTCVHRKYLSSKFSSAAKVEPALFIRDRCF